MIDRLDNILDALPHATGGEWIVRKTVDDSGDYEFPTYDILAIFPFGPQGVGCANQQPFDAILFSGAKTLAEEVIRLRKLLYAQGIEDKND